MSDWRSESECEEWANEAIVGDDGIVRNVALCGRASKNGYRFAESAFAASVAKYEGRPVFIDHAKDADRPFERSSRDHAGFVKNVTLRNGLPFGDIHTFPTHAGEHYRAMAKAKPPHTGMSHVARYRFNKDRTAVESVDEVASVDLVVYPATTQSFSEQTRSSEMADPTSDLTAHLKAENARLQAELTRSVDLVQERDASLAAVTKERDALKASTDTLATENKTLKAQVDQFAAEQAVAKRRGVIESKLKEHGFNPADAAVVTPVFMESLIAEPDDARREALIKDRKSVCDAAVKTGGVSYERTTQAGGGFDAAAYAKKLGGG